MDTTLRGDHEANSRGRYGGYQGIGGSVDCESGASEIDGVPEDMEGLSGEKTLTWYTGGGCIWQIPDCQDIRHSVSSSWGHAGTKKIPNCTYQFPSSPLLLVRGRTLRLPPVPQAEDGVQAPKHVLAEQEAGDDGNRYVQFAILL
ncbi:hypothetical protein AAG570_005915 [Ranatra chinensis]|uniref:Peptide-methionine (S)-S-oxide reductase n=1 Tax=Ranatra chinensis TaxID=642074 RepID=A0ABD0YK78_9HEMI